MPDADVERVLLPAEAIETRVSALAREIRGAMGEGEILALGVLTGSFVFLADLIRGLGGPLRVAFLKATSYRDGARPGDLELEAVGRVDLEGMDVVVVEDIVDTGRSLTAVLDWVRRGRPRTLRSVALLDKRERREVEITVDFTGFVVPDEFLVGYGLDFAERYRDLPYVGVLAPSVYRKRP